MNGNIMNGAWDNMVAQVLWEHTFLEKRLVAINGFFTFIIITNQKVRMSEETIPAREQ